MLMRKITSRARMPRIIRPVIEYLLGGGVRQLPIRPIYVGAGLGVKQAWARACSTWSGKGPKLEVGIVLIVYYPCGRSQELPSPCCSRRRARLCRGSTTGSRRTDPVSGVSKEALVLGIRYLPAIFPLLSLLLIIGDNWTERPAACPLGRGSPGVKRPLRSIRKPRIANDSRYWRSRVTVLGRVSSWSRRFLRTKSAIPGGPSNS